MSLLQTEDGRRAASIAAYDLLKAPPRRELVGLAQIAARICGTPMASVNILTATEQHQIATVGMDPGICSRGDSMCALILHDPEPVVVPDTREDVLFRDNPFVACHPAAVRFYAAHQLTSREGVRFGTLCVFDDRPRAYLDPGQMAALASLADSMIDLFEVRLKGREVALGLMEQQALQAELERSNERLASFAGQVSHDLKTPLTTLSLTLSLIREQLQDGDFGPDSVRLLDRAINGSSRMADLIDDVLDYARLGGSLKATEVNLNWVLGDVLEDLAHDLADVRVSVSRMPTVLGDRSQLRAVLQNLVANAAKYRHPRRAPEIDISARHVQRAWRIEVADNGMGIPREHQARVFEPLARIDDSVEGTGIGLATCRRIVGAHGGSIGLVPTQAAGARFYVELPG